MQRCIHTLHASELESYPVFVPSPSVEWAIKVQGLYDFLAQNDVLQGKKYLWETFECAGVTRSCFSKLSKVITLKVTTICVATYARVHHVHASGPDQEKQAVHIGLNLPNSRTRLICEQQNPSKLMHLEDRMSRHR